jgi:branched-chain amino acid transport system permease protein
MDIELSGLVLYGISLLTMGGIYAVLALGLNIQWGFTGLFNAGIAGFFAIGAYTTAILTGPALHTHVGGFGLPVVVGLVSAMILAGILGWCVGWLTLKLQSDYLAIATIGIAEILRLIGKNEDWLTNGPRGIRGIPRPFESLPQLEGQLAFLGLIIVIVIVIYVLLERGRNSPWGRVMRAIRENEDSARAAGKNILRFRMEAFVLGSMIMGLGGALFAHNIKFMGPEATEPLQATFLVWVMLIAGGSGNNKGAILGPVVIWAIWSLTELLTRQLPAEWAIRSAYIRVFLIGLALQIIIQRFSQGLLAEKPPKPIPIEDDGGGPTEAKGTAD